MKNKRGFGFVPIIIILGLFILLAGLLIWFSLSIKEGLLAVAGFMSKYAIWFFIVFMLVYFRDFIVSILMRKNWLSWVFVAVLGTVLYFAWRSVI